MTYNEYKEERAWGKDWDKEEEVTTCHHCDARTGFGYGVEPLRYDTNFCSTEHRLNYNAQEK